MSNQYQYYYNTTKHTLTKLATIYFTKNYTYYNYYSWNTNNI